MFKQKRQVIAMMVDFVVIGKPVPKGRPRFTTRGGYVRAITPPETVEYEKLVRASYKRDCGDYMFPADIALEMWLRIYMPIPKYARKRDLPSLESEMVLHTKRGDTSNILKSVEDALNGVAYKDDGQIAAVIATKCYSANPRVEVEIRDIYGCAKGVYM